MAGYFIGIDGGGSNLRAALVDTDLIIRAQIHASTVNPSIVGRDESARLIQAAVREVIHRAGLDPDVISGVGIGIAGASAAYAADWLRDVVSGVLPAAHIAPSSDMEIALVGAHSARRGILLLAGTGSVALGIGDAGNSVRAGGWGYLLGDEGSGCWLGLQALNAVARAEDGRGDKTVLSSQLLEALGLQRVQDITLWLYRTGEPRTRDVAQLAPLVMAAAASGDRIAAQIVADGARELALLCQIVIQRLGRDGLPIAFAGGLLEQPTILRQQVCELLGMDEPAVTQYPPVVGAALLAMLTHP